MTVKLLRAYGGFPAGATYDGTADVEVDLVNSGGATWDTRSSATGGGPGDAASAVASSLATGYRGQVANQGAMLALAASVGDECLRTDLGTGGLRYELTALPASTAGNWQPLQGTLADGTMVTLALVDGKLPRRLLVAVASGCQVTVAIGGVTQPVLFENVSGQYHEIGISDTVGAAQPTTLTIQRTAGSGTTSTWSVESGTAPGITFGAAPTYAVLRAAYPANGAALAALPAGTRVGVEDMMMDVVRSSSGKYWVPVSAPVASPKFTGSNGHWITAAGLTALSTSGGQSRKIHRATYWRMPACRPATVSRLSLYQNTAGAFSGAGSDSFVVRVYEANPDGSPIVGAAPLFVWDFNAAGSGGAAAMSLVSAGANATRLHANLPGGSKELPGHFWLTFGHDLDTTSPVLQTTSTTSGLHETFPAELSGSDVSNTGPSSLPRSTGYTWTEAQAWTIGDAPVWPSAEYVTAGSSCVVPHLKIA